MGHVIAVSGKGGVGKTTLCGLLIQYLCESGKRPVLAVDADANANLNEVLGVEPDVYKRQMSDTVILSGFFSFTNLKKAPKMASSATEYLSSGIIFCIAVSSRESRCV